MVTATWLSDPVTHASGHQAVKPVMTESDSKSVSRQSGPGESGELVNSRQLLGDRRYLTIEHNGERYQLRITSNNKLILTK
jgi:hemin uptake protein HemP